VYSPTPKRNKSDNKDDNFPLPNGQRWGHDGVDQCQIATPVHQQPGFQNWTPVGNNWMDIFLKFLEMPFELRFKYRHIVGDHNNMRSIPCQASRILGELTIGSFVCLHFKLRSSKSILSVNECFIVGAKKCVRTINSALSLHGSSLTIINLLMKWQRWRIQ